MCTNSGSQATCIPPPVPTRSPISYRTSCCLILASHLNESLSTLFVSWFLRYNAYMLPSQFMSTSKCSITFCFNCAYHLICLVISAQNFSLFWLSVLWRIKPWIIMLLWCDWAESTNNIFVPVKLCMNDLVYILEVSSVISRSKKKKLAMAEQDGNVPHRTSQGSPIFRYYKCNLLNSSNSLLH